MARTIAIFDFDHTLVSRDSLFDFLLYSYGIKNFSINTMIKFPCLIGNRLGIITSTHAKASLLNEFLHRDTEDEITRKMKLYSLNRIPQILNSSLIDRVNWHRRNNHTLVIASASIDLWISPWAFKHGFNSVIATQLAFSNHKFTGRLKGDNCSGKEKIKRIVQEFANFHSYEIYAYSDNRSDEELLKIAHHRFHPRDLSAKDTESEQIR